VLPLGERFDDPEDATNPLDEAKEVSAGCIFNALMEASP
jgi:hypothetical protein